MDVVDHEPAAWFLLADGEEMFLDVNCEGNAAGYTLLLELTADERRAIVLEGHAAADRIALEVAATPEEFWDRQIMGRGDEVADAITAWRELS
jgi:hypothetical protein